MRGPLRALAVATVLAAASGAAVYSPDPAISATAPKVQITKPTGPTVSGKVAVSASATSSTGVASVTFLVDGRSIGSDSSSPYAITGDSTRLSDGTHTLTARVTDRSGATATSAGRRIDVRNTTAPTPPVTGQAALEKVWASPPGGVFGSASEWKRVITGAPVARNSAEQVGNIAWSVDHNYNGVAAFNVWDYNTTVAVAGATQRRTRVIWDDCQHKGSLPGGLYGHNGQFEDVPIPDRAVPAAGGDSELTVYSPSSDQLWEFWVAKKRSDGWHACWGGRIDNASKSPGFFTRGFGATATGLPYVGGMVSIADARSGRIDHAIALQVIDTADWWKISYPAQRGDGAGNGPIREGTRFRLDSRVDVASLRLNPYAAMVARAAQKYGFIVVDKGGAIAIPVESGRSLAANGGVDPWKSLLGSTPSYSVLKGFPWNRLQALPNDWGKPAAG